VEREDVKSARKILAGPGGISARDAIHIAIMRRYGISVIVSFDSGFDRHPGISRRPEAAPL